MSSAFLIFLLVLITMALFAAGFKLFAYLTRKPIKKQKRTGQAGAPGVCPVCAAVLEGGQKIRSALFPGGNGRVCHIYGCPSCLSPESPLAEMRSCPVCKTKLGCDEYLIARVFDRGEKRQHVHILGCKKCRQC